MVRLFEGSPWFIPRGVAILFTAALLVIVLDAFLFQYVIQSAEENSREMQADRVQLDKLVDVKDLLQDAETGQRGYLLTGREEYLAPYDIARTNVPKVLGGFVPDPSVATAERAQVEEIARLANSKLDELQRTVSLFRSGARDEAMAVVQTDAGKITMDHIREFIEARQEAVTARQERARTVRTRIFAWGLAANVIVALLAATLLLFFGVSVVRHLLARHNFEASLQRSNFELERAVAERTEEMTLLSRHLLSVREEEKAALAREIHDGLGSSLTAVKMDLASAQSEKSSVDRIRAAVNSSLRALDTAIEQHRAALNGLHPSLLDTMGLDIAIRNYVAEFGRRTGINSEFSLDGKLGPLDDARAIALFRIVQEALNNVAKHAEAKNVNVVIVHNEGSVALSIQDDGKGLDSSADPARKSLGLISMRERARQFGGEFRIGAAARPFRTRVDVSIRTADDGQGR